MSTYCYEKKFLRQDATATNFNKAIYRTLQAVLTKIIKTSHLLKHSGLTGFSYNKFKKGDNHAI
jgi:hypothetical protein